MTILHKYILFQSLIVTAFAIGFLLRKRHANPERLSSRLVMANLVLIEILSMYCPFCQKEAPVVNRLHEAIEKDPAAGGKIKIIGVGAGNSSYEVEVFRKKYGVPFPVFPDPDYDIHKKCGEVRTPFFIAVRLNPDGTQSVTHARLGAFGEVPAFLETLKKAAGL